MQSVPFGGAVLVGDAIFQFVRILIEILKFGRLQQVDRPILHIRHDEDEIHVRSPFWNLTISWGL